MQEQEENLRDLITNQEILLDTNQLWKDIQCRKSKSRKLFWWWYSVHFFIGTLICLSFAAYILSKDSNEFHNTKNSTPQKSSAQSQDLKITDKNVPTNSINYQTSINPKFEKNLIHQLPHLLSRTPKSKLDLNELPNIHDVDNNNNAFILDDQTVQFKNLNSTIDKEEKLLSIKLDCLPELLPNVKQHLASASIPELYTNSEFKKHRINSRPIYYIFSIGAGYLHLNIDGWKPRIVNSHPWIAQCIVQKNISKNIGIDAGINLLNVQLKNKINFLTLNGPGGLDSIEHIPIVGEPYVTLKNKKLVERIIERNSSVTQVAIKFGINWQYNSHKLKLSSGTDCHIALKNFVQGKILSDTSSVNLDSYISGRIGYAQEGWIQVSHPLFSKLEIVGRLSYFYNLNPLFKFTKQRPYGMPALQVGVKF